MFYGAAQAAFTQFPVQILAALTATRATFCSTACCRATRWRAIFCRAIFRRATRSLRFTSRRGATTRGRGTEAVTSAVVHGALTQFFSHTLAGTAILVDCTAV